MPFITLWPLHILATRVIRPIITTTYHPKPLLLQAYLHTLHDFLLHRDPHNPRNLAIADGGQYDWTSKRYPCTSRYRTLPHNTVLHCKPLITSRINPYRTSTVRYRTVLSLSLYGTVRIVRSLRYRRTRYGTVHLIIHHCAVCRRTETLLYYNV